jgi:hypothetical protein
MSTSTLASLVPGAALLSLAMVFGCGGEGRQSNQAGDDASGAPGLDIRLGRDITAIRGGPTWPTQSSNPDGLLPFMSLDKPNTVTVALPSGRSFCCHSTRTIISEEKRTVHQVILLPLSELTDFPGALQELERIKDTIEMDYKALIDDDVLKWKAAAPKFAVSSGGVVEDRVTLFVELKPHSSEEGWFLSLTLNYYTDEEAWENHPWRKKNAKD